MHRLPIIVLLLLPACAPAQRSTLSDCTDATRHELFFGREKDGQLVVTDSLWDAFVQAEIKDRLVGFTVVDAKGQWTENGRIEEEPSKVVIVLAPPQSSTGDSLEIIIDAYKRTFNQYSVGWVQNQVCVEGFW